MAKNYELRIETSELKKSLDVLSTVVNRKNALPILSDVCLRYDRESKIFRLIAGNSEQWLVIDAVKPAEDQKEAQPWIFLDKDDRKEPFEAVCVNLVAMKEAFGVLPTMPVTAYIDLDNGSMVVDYSKGKFTMPVNVNGAAEQFPILPVVAEKGDEGKRVVCPLVKFSIDADRLLPLIAAARCCVASDELRPVMNSVCVDCFHDHCIVVATDGHSLFKNMIDTGMGWLAYGEFGATDSAKLLIPAQALIPLQKALGQAKTVTVTADSQCLCINSDTATLITVTIDGKYPNYDSVIPKDQKYSLLIDRNELTTSLRRISIFSAEASNMCILGREDDHLALSAADEEFGRNASEQVAVVNNEVMDAMPEKFAIGCKISTLEQLLACVHTDNVKAEMTAENKPMLLREDDEKSGLTLLIMPMLTKTL